MVKIAYISLSAPIVMMLFKANHRKAGRKTTGLRASMKLTIAGRQFCRTAGACQPSGFDALAASSLCASSELGALW